MATYKWHGDPELAIRQMFAAINAGKQSLRDKKQWLSYSIQRDNSINISFQSRTFRHFWDKDVSEADKALRREIYEYIAADCAFTMFGLADYGYTRSGWLQEWGMDWDDLAKRITASYNASLPPLDIKAALRENFGVVDYKLNEEYANGKPGYYVVETDGSDNPNIVKPIARFASYEQAVIIASRRANAGLFDTTDILHVASAKSKRLMSWVVGDDAKVYPQANKFESEADQVWLEAHSDEPVGDEVRGTVVRVRIVTDEHGFGIVDAYVEAIDKTVVTWYKVIVEDAMPYGLEEIAGYPPRAHKSSSVFDYYYDYDGKIIGVDAVRA